MNEPKTHVVIVLGMHRGGTSVVARALPVLGVPVGDNLLPSSADNPKGFWEDVESLAINEELLAHFNSAYDRLGLAWRFGETDPKINAFRTRAADLIMRRIAEYGGIWGFKDPRTSRLLPFWRETIKSCGCKESYVIALRNPLSVALSLEKRNGIPFEKSCFLWLQHMVPAILNSVGAPRLVVDYDLLLDEPLTQLKRISNCLGLNIHDPDNSAFEDYQKTFLEHGLRHATFTVSNLRLDRRVPEDVVTAYELLSQAAKDEISVDSPKLSRSFVNLNGRLVGYSAAFEHANQLEDDKARLYKTLAERDARNSSLHKSLQEQTSEIAVIRQVVSARDEKIARLAKSLAEREAQIASIIQAISERDRRMDSSIETISRRDEQIAFLNRTISEHSARIVALSEALGEHKAQIASINQAVTSRDTQIVSLVEAASGRDEQITFISQAMSEREARIASLGKALAEYDTEVASLSQAVAERNIRIASLEQIQAERDAQIGSIKQALSERDEQIGSLEQATTTRDRRIDSLTVILSEREDQITHFHRRESLLRTSMSWRVTAPLRYVYGRLLNVSKLLEKRFPRGIFRAAEVRSASSTDPANYIQEDSLIGSEATPGDYVDDTPPPPGFVPDTRLVAFYLPQFHPIRENDEWWGRGFTEWNNVASAKPQFKGHYQPHLPGELGFYDLRVKDVQRRQVELAKNYGIGAFCFYFYWFGNKTLLEFPIRQYLKSPELDLPFFLCWANENWTRRWDGEEEDVLIAQDHTPADDIAFIEYVAPYMRDSRYLRVNGRPVLLVYRPSLLPSAQATADRWRRWARQNGLGDLYLVYTQSFEMRDPADYGFDAATEFPPNLSGPPVLTEQIQRHNPDFSGIVYDWRILVERSRRYSQPSYRLFRAVCPSWDNEARRSGRGTVFVNSSCEGYREWLQNAVIDTEKRFEGDERLVFINAWNEWAEGAHLEPDQRYGYAWLHATREALIAAKKNAPEPLGRIVVVTHDAYPHGAQFIALNMVRELFCSLQCRVEIVCLGEGPLISEFKKYGRVHEFAGVDPLGPRAHRLSTDLFERGFRHAFVNTTVGGHFLVTLKRAGLNCVALVHELRELIVAYSLQSQAQQLAEHADFVVFPSDEVRDAFVEFASIPAERRVVLPQGLFKRNPYTNSEFNPSRQELRQKLGVIEDAQVVIGVGYGDLRKGVDYFLEVAAAIIEKDPSAHFVWVGAYTSVMEHSFAKLLERSPGLADHIHLAGYQNDTGLYYAGADAFALTSREDPFPCVVLEAMDAGLPIVAFQGSGGSNKLISEGLGENVPMGDCAAFAAAIRRLLDDKAGRERISLRGHALIAERYSFRRYVFELLALVDAPIRRISVVVPNFNYERYLVDRIATILNQTYPIYELLILDDASSDNSVELVKVLLAHSGIDYQIVANQTNSGSVFLQWKLGVERARGDIVWIAEADDLSDPNFLKTVVCGFDEPGVVLSYSSSKQIDEDGDVIADDYGDYLADLGRERWKRPYINQGEDEIRRYLAVKNTIPNVSAVLMRRQELSRVLEEHIEDIRSHKVAGDWKTYLHLLPGGRLAFFPQSLNLHRRHRRGVTISSFDRSQFSEIQEIQKWIENRYAIDRNVSQTMRIYRDVLREQFGIGHEVDDAY